MKNCKITNLYLRPKINVSPFGKPRQSRISYVQVKKSCGKKLCRICKGNTRAHGPYWYRVEWDAIRQVKTTTYIGLQLPSQVQRTLTIKNLLPQQQIQKLARQLSIMQFQEQRLVKENTALRSQVAQLKSSLEAQSNLLLARNLKNAELIKQVKSTRDELRQINSQLIRNEKEFLTKITAFHQVYKKLALKYHSDLHPQTEEFMKDINEMRQCLK